MVLEDLPALHAGPRELDNVRRLLAAEHPLDCQRDRRRVAYHVRAHRLVRR